MKILVTQLTRFGDILNTLPVLSALRRKHPEAEIHLLVRSRFSEAATLSTACDKLWLWRTEAIIGPYLLEDKPRALAQAEALQAIKAHIVALRREEFDVIYNFSFSPSSSFLTHLVANPQTEVFGYNRTSDFYLHIPDERSRYFRAQVGLGKYNRLHVSDIFAWIADVSLEKEDLECCTRFAKPASDRNGIVCHIGASTTDKQWTSQSWYALLRKLTNELKLPVTLVGSEGEKEYADQLALQVDEPRFLRNYVGETSLEELARLVGGCSLFIGADSGPLHIASLTGTRALNLSLGPVRFWETGPLVPGSRVIIRENPSHLSSEEVLGHVQEMLNFDSARAGCAECIENAGFRYRVLPKSHVRGDEWEMLEWLYFDGPSPLYGEDIRVAINQIMDVCVLASDLVESLEKDPEKTQVLPVLDRIDDLLKLVEQNYPLLRPLLWKFVVERENNPPGTREEVFRFTRSVYDNLLHWSHKLSIASPIGKDL